MTASELKRWLKQRGCTFAEGTKHTIVFFENRRTAMPRHPSKELNPNTAEYFEEARHFEGPLICIITQRDFS